ncbi:amidohydrolase family protein [Candidatus Xianfuyuplasma coldseepsis]|uniref:Amidohydrolase family protein n=1 Tax=Candidatus Xianfuyuplasma coldseepsis TaxID=2782163 RepID=A0A7L7KQB7_9MOLU|nr:amidohydrolase family protein [Xianfuyuplasma coldseepsis]QMS84406.1 amidohydrolase family protein [Xianfuyuplasma coldseepsis]
MDDLRIINGLVYQNNQFVPTNIYIKDGIISAITTDVYEAKETYDCEGDLVLPGIIDPHTHFELDLGTQSSKDDFYHGTKAAAFGGVTTIIDFLQPAQTASELHQTYKERKQQAQNSVIDYAFHACLRNPLGIEEIVQAMNDNHLKTVKIFTTYSESNRRTYDPEIQELLRYSKRHGFTVTAHIENDEMINKDPSLPYQSLPQARPTEAETNEALKLAGFVRETGGTLYMVHCSSGNTIQALSEQYSDILHTQFLVETCPHYVMFNHSVLNRVHGYLFTMAPPLRSQQEQELLIANIDNIDTIGTDHCTFLQTDKKHTLLQNIPLGVNGVEESFRILFTKCGINIIDKMTINVAKAHHLYPRKGVIAIGSDADLFIYRQQPRTITLGHGACDYTIYEGFEVNGDVISTISRGEFVVKHQSFIPHIGQLVKR